MGNSMAEIQIRVKGFRRIFFGSKKKKAAREENMSYGVTQLSFRANFSAFRFALYFHEGRGKESGARGGNEKVQREF